ncbi:MAG: hypothetical protein HY289_03010 [Planctomycetes bacterium]|nr:hypothetical protein [Planctomycetota bacterium]
MSDSTTTQPPAPIKRNHAWIYFFVFIFFASVGVAGTMIWFNLSIQLKPEQFEAAQQLWSETGPKSYDMIYTKQLNDAAKVDKFEVKVRDGKVTEVRMNGKPLVKESPDDQDPRIHHSMDQLFRHIERFMDIDRKPDAKKVYVTAIFDDKHGGLRKYIRRVMGTNTRIEMNVTIEPR